MDWISIVLLILLDLALAALLFAFVQLINTIYPHI